METVTVAIDCSNAHLQLMTHFNLLLRESLVQPSPRSLLDVVVDLLEQAQRHSG